MGSDRGAGRFCPGAGKGVSGKGSQAREAPPETVKLPVTGGARPPESGLLCEIGRETPPGKVFPVKIGGGELPYFSKK